MLRALQIPTQEEHHATASHRRLARQTHRRAFAPIAHLYELPISEQASELVAQTRQQIANILHGKDNRLLVIIGPCSIHDPKAALEYAQRLLPLRQKYEKELLIVMRAYFEKPRTTVGWKGLINDRTSTARTTSTSACAKRANYC